MFKIPDCENLSFEGLREILTSISVQLEQTKNYQINTQKDLRTQLESRPTMQETLKALANIPAPQQSLYIDVQTVDLIISRISNDLGDKLDNIVKTNASYEKAADKLFLKVHSAVQSVTKKFNDLKKQTQSSVDYTRRYILRQCQKQRLKKVFDYLKKRKDSKKASKQIIKSKMRKIHQWPAIHGFGNWKGTTNTIAKQQFQEALKQLKQVSSQNQKTLMDIQKSIKFLEREKASQIDVDEIKEVASKTDIRILFQDLKNIVVSYTNNMKTVIFIQKYNNYFAKIRADLENFRVQLGQKAQSKPINQLHQKTNLLKSELTDLSRQQQLFSQQILRTDNSALIENSDFKVALLEQKLQGFDSRLSKFHQERSLENSYSRVMQSVFSLTKKSSSPVISKKRRDDISEEMLTSLKTPGKVKRENIKIRTTKRRGSQA